MHSRSYIDFLNKKEICSELTSKGSAEDTLLLHELHKASATEREVMGKIIFYQPDKSLLLKVKLVAALDTVWLITTSNGKAVTNKQNRNIVPFINYKFFMRKVA